MAMNAIMHWVKSFLLTIALASVSLCALAQGPLIFNNYGAGANAPVTDWDGTNKLFGPTFAADLYYGPPGTTDSTLLTALRQPTPFWKDGYFLGGLRTIPGYLFGYITAQIRVWDAPDGDSYEAVLSSASPSARVGQSALFQQLLMPPGGSPPYTLVNLMPFKTVPVQPNPPPRPLGPPVTVTTATNQLLFSWPSYWQGWTFALQQSPSLTGANWLTLTNTPTLTGSQSQVVYQIAIPPPSGHMFYRLLSQ
jgi:hypothetical protein